MKLFPSQPASARCCACHWGLPFQGQAIDLIGQLDVREGVDHLGEDQGAETGRWVWLKKPSFLAPSLLIYLP